MRVEWPVCTRTCFAGILAIQLKRPPFFVEVLVLLRLLLSLCHKTPPFNQGNGDLVHRDNIFHAEGNYKPDSYTLVKKRLGQYNHRCYAYVNL